LEILPFLGELYYFLKYSQNTFTFSPPHLPRSDIPHPPAAEEFLRKFTTTTPFVSKKPNTFYTRNSTRHKGLK
jgi:hypothetical protein